jgi:O-antigen/teichoic acid export membrane protein
MKNPKTNQGLQNVNLHTIIGTTGFQGLIFLSGLIINKLIAVFSGPSGIALFGVVKNFYIFYSAILKLGSDNVVLATAARSQREQRLEQKLVRGIFRLILFQSVVIIFSLIFFDELIYRLVFEDILHLKDQSTIKVLLCMIFLTSISETLISFNNGRSTIRNTIIASLIGTLSTLLLVGILKPQALATVAILALTSGAISAVYLIFIFLRDYHHLFFSAISRNIFKELPTSVHLLIQPLIVSASFLIIQRQIGAHYGVEQLSFFIMGFILIGTFLTLLMSSLRMYFMPKLGSILSPIDRNNFYNQHLYLFLPIAALCSLVIVVASKYLVLLLYSSEFLEAAEYLAILASAIVPRTLGWIIATAALEQQKFRLYLASETLREFLYLAATLFLIYQSAEIKIIFVAFVAAEIINSLFWVCYQFYFSDDLKPKIRIVIGSYAFPLLLLFFILF